MTTKVPAGAKKPADHKPKVAAPDQPIMVTVRDVVWRVDPAVRDDFELLGELAEVDTPEGIALVPRILVRILGNEQYQKAMRMLRDADTKRVSVEDGLSFAQDLLAGLDPNS